MYVQWSINYSVSTCLQYFDYCKHWPKWKHFLFCCFCFPLSNVMEWTTMKIETFSWPTILTGHRSYHSQFVLIVIIWRKKNNEYTHTHLIAYVAFVWNVMKKERINMCNHSEHWKKRINGDMSASVGLESILWIILYETLINNRKETRI